MSDSIIAQVRALANCNAYDYQGGHYDADGRRIPIPNWSALLAHMQAQQAVVDAARKLREKQLGIYDLTEALAAGVDLDAALENLENNDGK